MNAPLDMETAAALLGYPKPVHHRKRVCAECGSDDLTWGEEWPSVYVSPYGTGYEIEWCQVCDTLTGGRKWVGR